MSERNTPKSEFHPEQISELEQPDQGSEPIIKYENETLKEIHQLLDDTAEAIAMATTNTAPWLALIIYLLQSLETHTKETDPFDESVCPDLRTNCSQTEPRSLVNSLGSVRLVENDSTLTVFLAKIFPHLQ